jgi:hypothetical protein
MAKSKKAAAAAAVTLAITAPCERDAATGLGALPWIQCNRGIDVITQAQLSATKALLLKSGFESFELMLSEDLRDGNVENCEAIEQRWREGDECPDWAPDLSPLVGQGWTLVAVLEVEGADPSDVVALFSKPAGMVDQVPTEKPLTPQKAWPFPKTEGGGPDAKSEPQMPAETAVDGEHPPAGPVAATTPAPAPAPAPRQDAGNPRAGGFHIDEWTEAHVATYTKRVEKHGDEDKQAVSMGLEITTENFILDRIDPTLRHALYKAKDEGLQPEIDDLPPTTPVLRCNSIERTVLPTKHEGWTLLVDDGIDEDQPMKFGGCKLTKFSVEPKQGGTVVLRFTVGTADIDAERLGYLGMHHLESLWIQLHAPQPKQAAIDGTKGHPGAAAQQPTAGDLFAQQHGSQPDPDEREEDIGDGQSDDDAPGDGEPQEEPEGVES